MKIVLVGSGNLAVHLGPALINAGHIVVQVVGRSEESASKLAAKLNCNFTISAQEISTKADVYILALRDEAIANYAKLIPKTEKLILHTSGTVSISVLKPASSNFGCLYPLQTFSRNRKIKFSSVPICLEAGSKKASGQLEKLAKSLSKNIHWIPEDKRNTLHLAAVFANNFSNHLYVIAEELLNKKGLEFELLRPLIAETASKIINNHPHNMQTGPARRGDTGTINKHLALLKNKDQIRKIYEILSNSILNHDGPRF